MDSEDFYKKSFEIIFKKKLIYIPIYIYIYIYIYIIFYIDKNI